MPLLNGVEFIKYALPSNTPADTKIFYYTVTNEAFIDYELFFNRVVLCNSLVWTCSLTLRPHLTYADSLRSEHKALRLLGRIPFELRRSILLMVPLTKFKAFNQLSAILFDFVKQYYFKDELIECNLNMHSEIQDIKTTGRITNVRCIDSLDDSNEPDRNPPNLIYTVQLEDSNLDSDHENEKTKLQVNQENICRIRGQISHERCRILLLHYCHRVEGIYTLKPKTIDEYFLKDAKFCEVFMNDYLNVFTTDMGGTLKSKQERQRELNLEKFEKKQKFAQDKIQTKQQIEMKKEERKKLIIDEKNRRKLQLQQMKIQQKVEMQLQKLKQKIKNYNTDDLEIEQHCGLSKPLIYKPKQHENQLFEASLVIADFCQKFSKLFEKYDLTLPHITETDLSNLCYNYSENSIYYEIIISLVNFISQAFDVQINEDYIKENKKVNPNFNQFYFKYVLTMNVKFDSFLLDCMNINEYLLLVFNFIQEYYISQPVCDIIKVLSDCEVNLLGELERLILVNKIFDVFLDIPEVHSYVEDGITEYANTKNEFKNFQSNENKRIKLRMLHKTNDVSKEVDKKVEENISNTRKTETICQGYLDSDPNAIDWLKVTDSEWIVMREKYTQLDTDWRNKLKNARDITRILPLGRDKFHNYYWNIPCLKNVIMCEFTDFYKSFTGNQQPYLHPDDTDHDFFIVQSANSDVHESLNNSNHITEKGITEELMNGTGSVLTGSNITKCAFGLYIGKNHVNSLYNSLSSNGEREKALKKVIEMKMEQYCVTDDEDNASVFELFSDPIKVKELTNVQLYVSYIVAAVEEFAFKLVKGGLCGKVTDSGYDQYVKTLSSNSTLQEIKQCVFWLSEIICSRFLYKPLGVSKLHNRKGVKKMRGEYYDSKDVKPFIEWCNQLEVANNFSKVKFLLDIFDSSVIWKLSIGNSKCSVCNRSGSEDCLLLCDWCNYGFHTFCLLPKISEVPENDWFCTWCETNCFEFILEEFPNASKRKKRKKEKRGRKRKNSSSATNGYTNGSSLVHTKYRKVLHDEREELINFMLINVDRNQINTSGKKIIKKLIYHNDSWPFQIPVDTKIYPDYTKIINRPMDLKQMIDKLDTWAYKNWSDFVSDIFLIFDNCCIYNKDNSDVSKAGKSLKNYFLTQMRKLQVTD
ncbi:hypothetical protein A3Q56_07132 [Intoshia linei]|uniref:Bromodomain adjacent to zinc finger domain protein 1A n=1 Tax=Intoshia linei TaxID=1819745 RepID=A0A177AT36_9BILA|nr:hypothetical protein A3Q56_07132 [Intoshia linei]